MERYIRLTRIAWAAVLCAVIAASTLYHEYYAGAVWLLVYLLGMAMLRLIVAVVLLDAQRVALGDLLDASHALSREAIEQKRLAVEMLEREVTSHYGS
jgi:hypothetical protein